MEAFNIKHDKLFIVCLFVILVLFSMSNVSASNEFNQTIQETSQINEANVQNLDDNVMLYGNNLEIYVNECVSESGNGTVNSPFKTINEAIMISNDGDTIYIASGIYSGVDNVALTIDKELSIKSLNKGNVILDGECNSWILYVTSSNVLIDGLTFVNGYANSGSALYFEYGSTNNIVNNSKFINNSANWGGALYFANDHDSQIINTVFENNTAINENYNDGGYGGAIYAYDYLYNTIFNNVTFKNNTASFNGGAINAYWGTNNCTYVDCIFKNNSVLNWNGGAINTYSSTYDKFINSSFENNLGGWGGAILFNSNTNHLSIQNTSFNNNHATTDGGAIYIWYGYNVSIMNSIFENNTSPRAGAIFLEYLENFNLTDDKFIANQADSYSLNPTINKFDNTISANLYGGNNIMNAIYASSQISNFIFSNLTYWGVDGIVNSDEIEPIYSNYETGQSITLEIYDGTTEELLYNVTELSDGDANVVFDYLNVSKTNSFRYIIYHNENSYYTSIYDYGEFNPKIGDFEALQYLIDGAAENDIIELTRNYVYTVGVDTITSGININKNNLTIKGNSYTINALGQSRIFNVQYETFNLNNLTLMNAYSTSNGGAIYFASNANYCNFNNITFINNTIKGGSNMGGGAIYIPAASYNNFTGLIFVNNTKSTGNMLGVIYISRASFNNFIGLNFTNNYANSGSAIYLVNSNNNIITNSEFINNRGIAVYLKSSREDILNCSVFNSNAGTLYFGSSTNNHLINLNFTNNSASKKGGAINFDGNVNNIKFVNVTFENNVAGSDGGSIFFGNNVKNFEFVNVAFENNVAGSDGGAIFFDGDIEINYGLFSNVYFINNTGRYGGAIEYGGDVELSDVKISDSYFINNSASNGGAISYLGVNIENVDYINVSFINNVHNSAVGSTTGGGAISYYGSTESINERIINSTFINNSASYCGGAIFYYSSSSSNYSIINTVFINNSAKEYGGAIYLGSMSDGKINNVTFINNTAGNGGAIYFIRECSNNEISDSIFVNNTQNPIYYRGSSANNDVIINSIFIEYDENIIIYASSGNVMANYNYFGNNASNYNKKPHVSSSVNLTNWLFLNATADEKNIHFGCKYYVKFLLESYDSKLESIVDDDYKNITQIVLHLTSVNENLSKNQSLIGESIEFVAKNAGNASITANYYNIYDIINFINIKENSTVTVNDISVTYKSKINLTAVCVGAIGIDVKLYNESGYDFTDYVTVNGFNININDAINAGNYILNVTTLVDDNYYSGMNSSKIIVNKANSSVRLNDSLNIYGDVVKLMPVCVNASDVEVKIYDENHSLIEADITVDDFNILIHDLNVGNYTVNITTITDLNHISASIISLLVVNKSNVSLILNNMPVINPKESEIIEIDLSDLKIDGILTYTMNNITSIINNRTIVLENLSEGNYTVLVELINDTNYNYASNYTTFIVSKVDYDIIVSSQDINVDETNYIVITLPGDATGNVTISINNYIQNRFINDTTVRGLNGILTMLLINDSFVADEYEVIVTYNGDEKYNPSNATTNFTVSKFDNYFSELGYENNTILVSFVDDAYGNVSVQIDNNTYYQSIYNGSARIEVSNLADANYTAFVHYSGNYKYNEFNGSINISVVHKEVFLTALDIEKYYHGSERLHIQMNDYNGNAVANENLTIIINGVSYLKTTNEKGKASIALNLNSGQYIVIIKYNGSEKFNSKSINASVIIKSTVNASDLIKVFRNKTQFIAAFTDYNGNYLSNGSEVEFNINGILYTRTVKNGLAKLNINLNQGEYIITSTNLLTGEKCSNIITVLSRIVDNHDLVKFYRNASQYVVRIIGDDGNPVGAGEIVTFNINGILYNRTTNSSGFAKLNIKLQSGNYTITAEYYSCKVSNNIEIKPVLFADDLVMNYLDGSNFNAKLLDGQGNSLANEKITFNVNGLFYSKTTNSSGIASLNIRLQKGKYIITSTYNGTNIANIIMIN